MYGESTDLDIYVRATDRLCETYEKWLSGEPVSTRTEIQPQLDPFTAPPDNGILYLEMDAFLKALEQKFGFTVPCKEMLDTIAQSDRSLVEVCAGKGFLASLLKRAKVEITATDYIDYSKREYVHTPVKRMDAVHAVQAYADCNVLMSWPSYKSSVAYDVAQAMQSGRTLYFIGDNPRCDPKYPHRESIVADTEFYLYLERAFDIREIIEMPHFPRSPNWLHVCNKKHSF